MFYHQMSVPGNLPCGKAIFLSFILSLCGFFVFPQVENDYRTRPGQTGTVWTTASNWEICNDPTCSLAAAAGAGGWVTAGGPPSGAAGVTIYITRTFSSRGTSFTLNGTLIISNGVAFTISNPALTNDFVVSPTGSFINNGTLGMVSGANSGNRVAFTVNGSFSNTGTVNFTNPSGLLVFNSDITNTGTINTNNPTSELHFGGGIVQTISGGTINASIIHVLNGSTINNNASIIINAGAYLFMDGSGNTFNANGSGGGTLTLASTSDNGTPDAAISVLFPGDVVNGNITVQRYISPNANRIYRYLSSPVQNATVAQWQDDFSITGSFTGFSTIEPSTGNNMPCGQPMNISAASLFTYDPATASYVDYPTTSNSAFLEPKVGYVAFIRACNTPITVDVTGVPNQGDQEFEIPYHGVFSEEDQSTYHLVGNPYPSPIDWGMVDLSSSQISSVINVADNTSGSLQYLPMDNNDGPSIHQIALGQAFWVSTLSSTSFTLMEDYKIAGSSANFYRVRETPKSKLVISLSDGSMTDKAYVKLNPNATKLMERNDGPKLDNDLFDISTMSEDNASLVVNSMDVLEIGDVIRIKTKDLTTGSYTLGFETEGELVDYKFTLLDKYTGGETEVSDQAYAFSVDDNAASKAHDRFKLTVSRIGSITGIEEDVLSISAYPNPVRSTFHLELPASYKGSNELKILDVLGNIVGSLTVSPVNGIVAGSYDFSVHASGVYFIPISSAKSIRFVKVIKP